MITEEEADRAVDYLRDSAQQCGQARASMVYREASLRRVKSLEMLANEGSLGDREARAYASDQYREAVEAFRDATAEYETIRAYREAAQYKIEAWRTMTSARKAGI